MMERMNDFMLFGFISDVVHNYLFPNVVEANVADQLPFHGLLIVGFCNAQRTSEPGTDPQFATPLLK